jgi:hypothetical protein
MVVSSHDHHGAGHYDLVTSHDHHVMRGSMMVSGDATTILQSV